MLNSGNKKALSFKTIILSHKSLYKAKNSLFYENKGKKAKPGWYCKA